MISYKNLHWGVRPSSFRQHKRRGAVVVLAALLMVFMIALLAFTIDLGYLFSARTEMQRTADAAALAGAWEMVSSDDVLRGDNWNQIDDDARLRAAEFAAMNRVINTNPALKLAGDIDLGYRPDPTVPTELESRDPSECNIVRVRLRYADDSNKPISLFFAPVLGIFSADLSVTAAATFSSKDTVGFGEGSTLLPFAVKIEDWEALRDGGGEDNWTVDPETGDVSPGSDGIPEMRMFPEKENAGGGITPGNFGTVDIGNNNNSARDLWRQIRDGPSAEDFSYYPDSELKLDPNSGTLSLNGDTGMTTSMKTPLNDVIRKGKSRTIFLYEATSGQGNQTQFTINGFAGIRVMDVNLTGNDKSVLIQPAFVFNPLAIADANSKASDLVNPRVYLVRY